MVTFTRESRKDFIKRLVQVFALWQLDLQPAQARELVRTFHSRILPLVRSLPGFGQLRAFETLGQDAAEYSRKSFESATATLKTLASVKSPTEFFKLQSDFVRGAFDSYVAEASKTTEAVLKLAGDAAQPLSNRAAVAVEKVKLAA